MLKQVDHLGIAVSNLEESVKLYKDLLGFSLEGVEEVEDQKVKVAIFNIEGKSPNIELLEPTSEESPIYKFIEKRGEGIHHIALGVKNIEEMLMMLKEKGVRLIDEKPRIGAGGKKIAFLHPKSTKGVLIELCEDTTG
ncbi:MAG TPA: methylmalonyl-CoA epimerase [Candidatus Atribacteria bacterium]|nr:methylmalonyl-CoA epimerase [Candidatus Atribacteria bacterium]